MQVRVHHVPCDTTELCTRRFGAETSKPDVGQPRLKALLRLPQVPFFCKNAPFFAKKALQRYFKGPCGEKRGVQTPLFLPAKGPFLKPNAPFEGPFFAPPGAFSWLFGGRKGPSNAHRTPIKGPSKAHQRPIKRPSNAHQMPIKCPSNAHQMPSKGLIKHPFALPLMSIRCPVDGPLLSL